ncbi:MAG: H-type lectin domain-containing protein [Chloroflexota bacterium]
MLSKNKNKALQLVLYLLPTPGNVIFTILVVSSLLWVQSAGAFPSARNTTNVDTSVDSIPYQGYLTDLDKNPLDSTYTMTFRLYNTAEGGTHLWEEFRTGSNSVQVNEGIFNVMLGSSTPIPNIVISENSSLWLGITVGADDEMVPRVPIGAVPYAIHALTVPDGSITTEKLSEELKSTMIQSGYVEGNSDIPEWTLDEDTGNRTYEVPIEFEKSFSTEPTVVVGLAGTDVVPNPSNRLTVSALNINRSGFTLRIRTWADTTAFGATATWIAYTSP